MRRRHTDFVDESLHCKADAFRTLARFEFEILDGVADHCVGEDVAEARRNARDDESDEKNHRRCRARVRSPVNADAHDKGDEHCNAADDVRPDISVALADFLREVRHEQRCDESAGNDRHRKERIHGLFVHYVFCKVKTARVGEQHSRRTADARKDDEHKGFILEQELEIVSQRRRIFHGYVSFRRVLEAKEEKGYCDHAAHDCDDEVDPFEHIALCKRVKTLRHIVGDDGSDERVTRPAPAVQKRRAIVSKFPRR